MADVRGLRLAHIPDSTPVFVALFKDVTNAAFLRRQLVEANTEYEYAFLDASTILSCRHVLAAVFRAINDKMAGRLKSRNVHSEIVFSLSPNNNIAESFRRFGINDNTKNLLAIKVPTDEDTTLATTKEHLTRVIEGSSVDFRDDNLGEITNIPYLRKVYKLESEPKYLQQFLEYERQTEKKSVPSKNDDKRQLKEYLESVILGTIALKGW